MIQFVDLRNVWLGPFYILFLLFYFFIHFIFFEETFYFKKYLFVIDE